jgi:hypothetical protein
VKIQQDKSCTLISRVRRSVKTAIFILNHALRQLHEDFVALSTYCVINITYFILTFLTD